ncbi:hypothetical protein [Lentzea sp. NBRC 105346]|uniref:hypothetical protein n=1 Tax=Lentzea sp. NBRC 105346 TaxID=3032205 RepID=UPI0025562EAC|nr:hypothetical protein [Lentzea sp. NBRC 105346]
MNDNLKQRQGSGAITYTVLSGSARVGHGKLAVDGVVMVDAPSTGSAISATLTPSSRSSIALSESANIGGNVADPATNLGFVLCDNGDVELFSKGVSVRKFSRLAPHGPFRVSLTMSGSTVDLSVNGARRKVDLAVPTERLWVYLGSGSVDNLRFAEMNSEHLRKRSESLRYFGYHGADQVLRSVRGRSNINQVSPAALSACAPGTCIVDTGDTFFDCTASCVLRPDHAARWQQLASRARGAAGFSVLDQAFARRATPADVATSARLIKQTFPGTSVLQVEAGSKIDADFSVPAEVDRVGFYEPGLDYEGLEARMNALQERVPDKDLLLLPESSAIYLYLGMFDYYPRYVGMMVRGGWGPDSVDAQERAAARVLGDAR